MLKIFLLILLVCVIFYLVLNYVWMDNTRIKQAKNISHKSSRRKRVKRPRDKETYALALSGGGYRAMLYHVGVLWRLHELGLLRKMNTISSVSGGSIIAAHLALRWDELYPQNADGEALPEGDFEKLIVEPVMALADKTVMSIMKIIKVTLLPRSVSYHVETAYNQYLYHDANMSDTTSQVKFVILSTNLRTAKLAKFMRNCFVHQRQRIYNPIIPVAKAVTASSAFPPFLAPVRLKFELERTKQDIDLDFDLADGGIYDNLGLEEIDNDGRIHYDHIFVSDAGAKYASRGRVSGMWFNLVIPVLESIDSQVRALRIQQLYKLLKETTDNGKKKRRKLKSAKGAFWQIHKSNLKYGNLDIGYGEEAFPSELACSLAKTPTVLSKLKKQHQKLLINWGYVSSDNGLRRFYDAGEAIPAPKQLPFLDAMENWQGVIDNPLCKKEK